ncbi:CapA family protein [Parachitinimonas caeni]|uniref:CapA family protein n=1 Tax=Parachitinimonas caeni TaxID=3031301 RepID=A0ABT7E2B9_9NEIS|nr:CapA family protein [Parachitinimonas caeni]MDK2126456.1 CapA family protein [Parachitinimonas caeni]
MASKLSQTLLAGLLLAGLTSLPAAARRNDPDTIRIAACGDVMMQNQNGGSRLPDKSLARFMSAMRPLFLAADVAYVNLEGPIGGSLPKNCRAGRCYRFSQSPLTARTLSDAGVNIAGVANNHAADMGETGQQSTRTALALQGIDTVGYFDVPSISWQLKHQRKVRMLAFSANSFAPDFRRPEALQQIQLAKRENEVLVIAVHMGCEGERCARIPGGAEWYQGENRGDPVAFARAAIDAGADLVLGSGPHVPRALEVYRERLIAYSLGNCAVGPGIDSSGKAGWAPLLTVTVDREGRLLNWDVASFRNNRSGVILDEQELALRWMLDATAGDFGQGSQQLLLSYWNRSVLSLKSTWGERLVHRLINTVDQAAPVPIQTAVNVANSLSRNGRTPDSSPIRTAQMSNGPR